MKKDIMSTIRDMLFWYAKENEIIFLPIHFFSVIAWIVLCKLLVRRGKPVGDKYTIGFTSLYFNGNARAVFEYMSNKNETESICFWIARNIKTYKYLKKLRKKVVYMYFPFTALDLLKNTSVLVTNDSYLSFLFPKMPKTIQLWHGEGPKGIDLSYDKCTIWCVPSEFIKERHLRLWKAPSEKLYVCGSPRLDILKSYLKRSREEILDELNIRREEKKKILLYAPTFDVGLWPWGDQYKGFEKLCEFCKKNDLILILRLHPLAKISKRKVKRIVKRYENVHWLDMPKEPDTMKLLAITDILITDWSSIYTDFFLTKRPIIYMEVDPNYYVKERGKSQVPPEFRAGEISRDEKEFFQALHRVLKIGNRFSEKQHEMFKIIYGAVDGKSCERVTKIIRSIVRR